MRVFIIIIGSILISACVNLVPHNGKSDGMLVLPIKATSPNKSAFSYRYILHLDKHPQKIILTPNVSNDYLVIDRLEPGTYTITGVSAKGRRNYSAFAKSRYKPVEPINIEFTIEADSITILETGFYVHSNIVSGRERADDTWGFAKIDAKQYEELYFELSHRGYLRNWVISDTSPSIFALN